MSNRRKMIVDYTGKEFKGMKSMPFETEGEALSWVATNKELIYWSSLRKSDPASLLPKIKVGSFDLPQEYIQINGTLETYFETGMECIGLVLYDKTYDATHPGTANPHFDQARPESSENFKYYKSMEATHFLKEGDVFKLASEPERYLFKKDREFAGDDAYRLSFYPQGYSRKELMDLFSNGTVKATVWTKS